MPKIISVANQKGGVGKTTTAVNIASNLAEFGKKVLAIDCDPQGNMSSGFGIEKNQVENTLYDVLISNCQIHDAIFSVPYNDTLHVIPSNMNLSGAEIELLNTKHREYILKTAINNLKNSYDYIIIDCPPSLNILTLNSLIASNSVLVPIQCEYYALEGLTQLIHTINLVTKKLNENLYIEGLVFTMFDSRTNLSTQVVDEVKSYMGDKIYNVFIPRNVKLSEAPSHGLPINYYDSRSKGAESYKLLTEEILYGRNY